MRNRGLEVAFLPDQLTASDLVWCLTLMGMPSRSLPEMVVEQHMSMLKASVRDLHCIHCQFLKLLNL